jgi:CubicO group peptidase (beta-lactamase class C family)
MDLVEEWVFEPLKMESSTFIVTAPLDRRLSSGYANDEDGSVDAEFPAREHRGRGYKVPNGGVYSTVADLGLFIGGLTGTSDTEILTPSSRAEMQRTQTPEGGSQYGLGLRIRETEDGIRMLGHGGTVAGYNAYMVFEPESRLGVVLLRNYNRGESSLGDAAAGLLADLVEVRQEQR